MNKNKGKEEEIRQKVKCDCRQCRRAGPVENFMVYCPIHDCGRSTGLRMCEYFIDAYEIGKSKLKLPLYVFAIPCLWRYCPYWFCDFSIISIFVYKDLR